MWIGWDELQQMNANQMMETHAWVLGSILDCVAKISRGGSRYGCQDFQGLQDLRAELT